MTERTPTKKSRHPATSARILATGLSATAILGLTSALAMVKPSWDNSTTTTVAGSTESIGQAILGSGLSTGTTATPVANSAAAPQTTTGQGAVAATTQPAHAKHSGSKKQNTPTATNAPASPQTTQAPVVITVPPPPPPSSGGNSGTPSKSNGS